MLFESLFAHSMASGQHCTSLYVHFKYIKYIKCMKVQLILMIVKCESQSSQQDFMFIFVALISGCGIV